MSDKLTHCMCGCIYEEPECPRCNKITDKDRIEELEAKLAKAEARLKNERGLVVHCYWDADDREIGHLDICEILDAYDFGTVAEIEHVAVISTTFEAQLPPADDSETDDLFEVCEHTREAAEAKVAAEISRRTTLAELKG